MHKRFFGSLTLAAALLTGGNALAQVSATTPNVAPQITPPARSEVVAPAPSRNIAPSNELPPAVSTHDPRPPAPSPIIGRKLTLVRQAGIGSPTGYARGGVMEFGGGINFLNGRNYTALSVSPMVGFFLTNNFELSAIFTMAYNRDRFAEANKTAHNLNLIALIEPSVHLPIVDHVFVFAGLGLGVAYNQLLSYVTENGQETRKFNDNVGFALAPRVGFDIMVGRSGIISPAFNLTWSTNAAQKVQTADGTEGTLVAVRTLVGASLNYRVMF